jgi:hypothetical protein
MKMNRDSLQFESRNEINAVMDVLQQWIDQDKKKETQHEYVQRCLDLLETMWLYW